jgi:hypothetical protein
MNRQESTARRRFLFAKCLLSRRNRIIMRFIHLPVAHLSLSRLRLSFPHNFHFIVGLPGRHISDTLLDP